MPRRVRPVSHEDQLTLVEHLDELRNRLIVSLAVFGVALALCFWQSSVLLEIASDPLPAQHERLLTFGVTEPFTTTVTVAAYGAIILSMPVLIYQLYAYILPAFSDAERRTLTPILILAPILFLVGVAFAYFVVMPPAVRFLLGVNESQFEVQVRARDYYSFFSTTMLAGGVIFELPLAIIAVTRLGIVSVSQLTANRRYAYLLIAILAAALPGVDPISMLLEMVPLVILFELSILLARVFERRAASGRNGRTHLLRSDEGLMAGEERRMLFDIRGRAEERDPRRLRLPRAADGRQPLRRGRPLQHRRILRRRRHHQRRRDLRRTGGTNRKAARERPQNEQICCCR